MNASESDRMPIVWSIAGSDSGAGAGLQADLRAFDAIGVHGCTAVAAITAQNSVSVERVDVVDVAVLDAQLAALAGDMAPRAIKTGMLGSAANVRCVAAWIDRLRSERPGQPVALVVDPVWRASSGADLAGGALREAVLTGLLPRATAITPNRAEAAWLLDWHPDILSSLAGVEQAAAALRALGPGVVVITGGDAGGGDALDFIDTPQAQGWLRLPRIATIDHHGSGCVFASSLAGALAHGFCEADAAVIAKMATAGALRHAGKAGRGPGPVRPQRGFGLEPDLLPDLLAPSKQQADNVVAVNPPAVAAALAAASAAVSSVAAPFAALSDRQLGLYAVVDSAERIEQVLAAGVRTVQLRIKHGTTAFLSDEIARSVAAARRVGAQLFINDHWQLAIEHGAYGVHLGQEDLHGAGNAALRALHSAGLRLGLSTHSYWEICRAKALQPSYIACGPIHATVTKDMPWLPQGAANLAYWCHVLRVPVVAIAGMDVPRSIEAVRCGAAGVAVLRGVSQSADLPRTVRELQAVIASATVLPPLPPPLLPRSTLPRTAQ